MDAMYVILLVFFVLMHAVMGVVLLMVGIIFVLIVTGYHYQGEHVASCEWDDACGCMCEDEEDQQNDINNNSFKLTDCTWNPAMSRSNIEILW